MNNIEDIRVDVKSAYTQIPNVLLELVISKELTNSDVRILLLIARKTYGFHKDSDRISLSQFQKNLHLSRQTVVTSLKKLQLVNLIRLVNKGKSKKASNEYRIDLSDFQNKRDKLSGLVKFDTKKLVNPTRHTKESITKENVLSKDNTKPKGFGNPEINDLIFLFKKELQLEELDGSSQKNRQYAQLCLNKFKSKAKVEEIIQACAKDPFWSNKVTSFTQLYYKAVQILRSSDSKGGGVNPKKFEMEDIKKYEKFK